MTDPACGLCNDRKKYPDGVVIRGCPVHDPAFTQACWRRGRKVGRTIYAQRGLEPSDDDMLIGVMDTPELAALVVDAVNAY